MTSSNLYPFQTKAAIKERIVRDQDFAIHCAQILTSLQTEAEQARRETIVKNRAGWMSSHAVFGTKACERLASGEELEPHEAARLQEMTSHYSKQLAGYFRQEAIRENPALAAAGRVFGV